MGQYVTTQKGRTLFIHDTAGDRGTIIGVHGLTGNHKQLHFYQEALAAAGYRFISYDLSGRGNSGPAPEDSSIFTHAADLLDLIDRLGIRRPIFLGYSMGAYISAVAASRRQDTEALILLDGAGKADEDTRNLVLPSLSRLEKTYESRDQYTGEAKSLYRRLGVEWGPHMEDAVSYEIRQEAGIWRNKAEISTVKRDFKSFYDFRPEDIFPEVRCPTLLLIATGSLGNKGPLFKEESYAGSKELLYNVWSETSPANHYELVFNRQPELNEKVQLFLAYKGVTP
ncbi:alpha/beta fold hydrolase [Siminovitchia sediminis]|uniref:Alpha/beta fold hydrolase n=1 Tax=Siminovitchia sediminis TaxID=1274353 RepID=A0ABW4KQ52_9BACI